MAARLASANKPNPRDLENESLASRRARSHRKVCSERMSRELMARSNFDWATYESGPSRDERIEDSCRAAENGHDKD